MVIGIIALLIAILLPTLSTARRSAKSLVCKSNLRQITAAAITRASIDDRKGIFFPQDDGANDSLAYLTPDYIDNPETFICPGTMNQVRTDVFIDPIQAMTKYGREDILADVVNNAKNALDETGHSYEVFAWYSFGQWPDGQIVDMWNSVDRNQQRGLHPGDPDYYYGDRTKRPIRVESELKRFGKLYNPSATILILDSDQDPGNGDARGNYNNWPDDVNNHGSDGTNIAFGDGHVEFFRPTPALIDVYMKGYQGPAQNINFTMEKRPGLTITNRPFPGNRTGRKYTIEY